MFGQHQSVSRQQRPTSNSLSQLNGRQKRRVYNKIFPHPPSCSSIFCPSSSVFCNDRFPFFIAFYVWFLLSLRSAPPFVSWRVFHLTQSTIHYIVVHHQENSDAVSPPDVALLLALSLSPAPPIYSAFHKVNPIFF